MNTFWSAITSNYIINVGVTSWFSAQLIKTVLTFLQYRELRAERLFGAGGKRRDAQLPFGAGLLHDGGDGQAGGV